MRVLVVVGCRPQFVKLAALAPALERAGVDWEWVDTGQHYDAGLAGDFVTEFGLKPPALRCDWRMIGGRALGGGVPWRPDWVVVFGDTDSAMAGARRARDRGVPLAHVEAGCRSFDTSMPEERNRLAIDGMADLLLCVGEKNAEQLRGEGVPGRAVVVGDLMRDVHRVTLGRLPDVRSVEGPYVLVTVHREANVTDERRLRRICGGLQLTGRQLVFPAHPRTRASLDKAGIGMAVLPPQGYRAMQELVRHSSCVVTDSGGLQKEAYWHRTPCVTVRASTEWTETVEAGANVLVDDDPDAIAEAVRGAVFPDGAPELYGDGFAADRIVAVLLEEVAGRDRVRAGSVC